MINGNSVLGKPVLSRADGEKLDTVKDVIVSTDHTRVIALLLNEGNILRKPTVVPIENVVSFGKDAVVITDREAVVRADHVPAVAQALDIDQRLSGRRVYAESGDHKGKVADIYFDDKTGDITGIDVTDITGVASSKQTAFLEKVDIISFGADAVVISTAGASRLTDEVVAADASAAATPDVAMATAPFQGGTLEPPSAATTDAPPVVARVADENNPMEGRTDVLPPLASDTGTGGETVG
jgi:uncharacterized protein YrrD